MCVCGCGGVWWRVFSGGGCVCVRVFVCGGARVMVRVWWRRWWWRRACVCARLCGCGDVWRRVCGGACVAAEVCVCVFFVALPYIEPVKASAIVLDT